MKIADVFVILSGIILVFMGFYLYVKIEGHPYNDIPGEYYYIPPEYHLIAYVLAGFLAVFFLLFVAIYLKLDELGRLCKK